MLQRARTLFFTFNKLINIILRSITSPQPELLLFYAKIPNNFALLAFYIDDIFGTYKSYQKQYIFLHDYFFLYWVWSKLKLAFFKLKIEITNIFAFRKEDEIG